jgi:signal transduction histidine kinase
MPAAHSLHLRLLLGTLLWIVATIGVTGWVLQGMFEQHLSRQFHAELATHLNQLAAHLEINAAGQPEVSRILSDPRLERPYSGLYWQVDRMPSGNTPGRSAVLRSRSLWDGELQVPADHLNDGEQHEHRLNGPKGESLRMIEQSLYLAQQQHEQPAEHPQQTLRLIVAADEKLLAEPVDRFRGLLLIALSLLAAGLILAAVVQVFAGLRPLKHLRDELGRLRDGEQALLGGSHPSEIQPLVDELNTVLERNAEFVERARSQAGNLAHAVKTPLAVMANAAAAEQGEWGELADIVSSQIDVARQHIDHHLSRARIAAAAQGRGQGQHCQLRPAAEGLLRVMQRVHAERHLALHLDDSGDSLVFRGEAQDLQEMLGNLIDNACKWASSEVRVAAIRQETMLCIDIDDDGPGIAAADRSTVLQRGQRGDERVPGSGLGLAIVDDLASLYAGRLELLDSPRGGLRARLWLPAGKNREASASTQGARP